MESRKCGQQYLFDVSSFTPGEKVCNGSRLDKDSGTQQVSALICERGRRVADLGQQKANLSQHFLLIVLSVYYVHSTTQSSKGK